MVHGNTTQWTKNTTSNNKSGGTYTILTTGATEGVKKNNIYDVAGNLWEWTQEAAYASKNSYSSSNNYNTFMLRGGAFYYPYSSFPACYRGYIYAPCTDTNFGFRVALYLL